MAQSAGSYRCAVTDNEATSLFRQCCGEQLKRQVAVQRNKRSSVVYPDTASAVQRLRALQVVLSLPEPLQDAVMRGAVLCANARTNAIHPRLHLPDHVRVPHSGVVASLLAHLPCALHACVVRACVRAGTELYLPLAGLTAAAIVGVAECLPLPQSVLSAAFPELQGGAPAPLPPLSERKMHTCDVLRILAQLPGITRLTLHGATLSAPSLHPSAFQLQQLLCLDLTYSSGRAAELVLACAMPQLRTLSLSHIQGEWPTLAADVARLTTLRVLSLAGAQLSLDARLTVADALLQLPRLRSLNVSQWRLPSHMAKHLSRVLPHLPTLEHLVMVGTYQDAVCVPGDNAGPEIGSQCLLGLCKHLRDLDVSDIAVESRRLIHMCDGQGTQLTALHLAQKQVLGAPPTIAGIMMAQVLLPLRSLARLTVSGFAACTEAALMVAAAAPETLTHLELCSPLNKLHAAPPDFAQLGVLCGLRALRMSNVDWHAQGVPAAAVADTLAAMPQLRELLITVPADALGRASWLQEALAGVATDLDILRLSGPLLGQPGAPAAHTTLADMLVSVGVRRLTALRLLAVSDEPTPGLTAAAGLAAGVRVVHHSETECAVDDVHGAIACWDVHDGDVMAMHERYAA